MGTGAELGNTFLVGWVGWLERLELKLTSAKVEAELGKKVGKVQVRKIKKSKIQNVDFFR